MPLRNGGGLVDVPGRGLLAAKGEYPFRVPYLPGGSCRPSSSCRADAPLGHLGAARARSMGYACAVVLVASQHVSVVWSCSVTGSASGRLGNVPNAELDGFA